MMTNDETLYQGQALNSEEEVQNENETVEVTEEAPKKKLSWKTVALGATTGVLLGAGALYAHNAYGANTDETAADGQGDQAAQDAAAGADKVAEVDDKLSFDDAFEAARMQVGPGGVFEWHNGVFSTYTKEEWDAMTPEEKEQFANMVETEVKAGDIDVTHINANTPDITIHHIHHNVTPDPEPDPNPVIDIDDHTQVEIVGQGTMEIADGVEIGYTDAKIHSTTDVKILDMDNDGNPDLAFVDANHDGIHTGDEMVILDQPTEEDPDIPVDPIDPEGDLTDDNIITDEEIANYTNNDISDEEIDVDWNDEESVSDFVDDSFTFLDA